MNVLLTINVLHCLFTRHFLKTDCLWQKSNNAMHYTNAQIILFWSLTHFTLKWSVYLRWNFDLRELHCEQKLTVMSKVSELCFSLIQAVRLYFWIFQFGLERPSAIYETFTNIFIMCRSVHPHVWNIQLFCVYWKKSHSSKRTLLRQQWCCGVSGKHKVSSVLLRAQGLWIRKDNTEHNRRMISVKQGIKS